MGYDSGMTEHDWLTTTTKPIKMVEKVRSTIGLRKELILGCAACRLLWDRLADHRLRQAIEVAENYTSGVYDAEQFMAARDAVQDAPGEYIEEWQMYDD